MERFGQIEIIPIASVKNNQMVLNKGMVCEIKDCSNLKSIEISTVKGAISSFVTLSELRSLVFRYNDFECGKKVTKSVPLNTDNWEDVLKLRDTKTVKCEIADIASLPCKKEKTISIKQADRLQDSILNLLGVFDNPIVRRNINEFQSDCIKEARETLEWFGTLKKQM